eukprot:gnl/TRDRNA2_/TRDRNA2_67656_c0_seq1.p1 gnl/TRDRNA2_/TRDRNA2_67656_c0~~gnl/TRDRNA2_/TRDRNA2_67656_c0_seq1.p1  ORF type:complete len:316 (-),score=32.87 gnl/TRDRNA2_/TRDRNA2_67656_c0_seq1:92-1039(-)
MVGVVTLLLLCLGFCCLLGDGTPLGVAASQIQQQAGIQVIGAGLGRTGTMTLQEALRILGYRTYHMEEFLKDASHPAAWRSFAETSSRDAKNDIGGAAAEKLFAKITSEGYNATMDNPMCDVYQDQLRLFPDAKVVLTHHPKGSAGWFKSFSSLLTLVRVQSKPWSWSYPNFFSLIPMFQDINAVRCMMGTRTVGLEPCELMYGSEGKPLEWWQEVYEKHANHVKRNVPPNQLLVFDVSQGWEPLCAFLKQPIPEVPFPHSNDSAAIRRLAMVLTVVIYAWMPTCGGLLFFLLYCLCCGPCSGGRRSHEGKVKGA